MSFPVIRDATTGSQVAPSFLDQYDPSVVNYQNAPAAFLATNPPVTADTDGVTFWMVYYAWMYWYLHNLFPTPQYTWSGDITNDLTGYTGPVYTYSPSTGYEKNGVPINRVLTSIAIGPANPSNLPVNATQQFTATGTYSDGSTADITSLVGWTSSTPKVATISYQGVATGLFIGSTSITAAMQGITSNAITLTVIVAAPTLVSLAVTPLNPGHLAIGSTQQFTATGTYSDGSTEDLTAHVNWVSLDPGIAIISPDGLATAVAAGTTKITAALSSIASTPITLMVVSTTTTLSSIAVSPSSPSLAVGATLQFSATGTYSDGSVDDITSQVTWASSNTDTAAISSSGLATGVAAGTTAITASLSPVTSTPVSLTVTSTPGPGPAASGNLWESLLPMPPQDGPPLPSFMAVRWPWQKPLTPPGNLQITVYDATTTKPLQGAAVTVTPGTQFLIEVFERSVTPTDVNGFCSFTVPVGTYFVQCAKMGYDTQAVQVAVSASGGKATVNLGPSS